MGRPRLNPRHFDLVITTPQYGVPRDANVALLTLPYESTADAVRGADPVPAHGTGPVLVVLGGNSWAQRLTEATVDELAAAARSVAAGAPMVAVSSPRTPPAMSARLGAALGPEVAFYDWGREKGAGNPHRAHLAATSRIVMSGDSVSGLADAIWTGRPVSVLPVPEQPWMSALRRVGGGLTRRWRRHGGNLEIGAPPPDMEAFYDNLISSGMARRGASGLLEIESGRDRLAAERQAVIERVRVLAADR
jgi:mitochondrial fission protein ELM1